MLRNLYIELTDWYLEGGCIRGKLVEMPGPLSIRTTRVLCYDPKKSIATTESGSLYKLGKPKKVYGARALGDLVAEEPLNRNPRPLRGQELRGYLSGRGMI